MISSRYRQALSAEAAGDYLQAARAYALCGQRHKVAEMHLLEAERLGAAPEAVQDRIQALRTAAHWADDRSEAGRALLGRIGRAYLGLLRRGFLQGRDRRLHEEAADLLRRAGDPAGAAEVFELAGDLQRAAECYEEAGDVDRVEALLAREERLRQAAHDEQEHFERHRILMLLGRRDEALLALRACIGAAQDPTEPRRLLEELEARLLRAGRVRLRRGQETPWLCAGRFPLLLGRDEGADLVLRDPGVSRLHASIAMGPTLPGTMPTFTVRDLGSRNGTTLAGLPLAGELPLHGEGEIGIGGHCTVRFRAGGARLELEVIHGLGRGQRLLASPAPIPLAEGVELRFCDGRPWLCAAAPVVLNGQRGPAQVQLIIGDLVEVAGEQFVVLP
ncbi:MAG: FHA domain-containing protein [Myxococcota bacterium]|nr:FHA domain-containing protein [Myxococcota bacterium]